MNKGKRNSVRFSLDGDNNEFERFLQSAIMIDQPSQPPTHPSKPKLLMQCNANKSAIVKALGVLFLNLDSFRHADCINIAIENSDSSKEGESASPEDFFKQLEEIQRGTRASICLVIYQKKTDDRMPSWQDLNLIDARRNEQTMKIRKLLDALFGKDGKNSCMFSLQSHLDPSNEPEERQTNRALRDLLFNLMGSGTDHYDLVRGASRVKERQQIESEILASFPEVQAITGQSQEIINSKKNGRFAWSLMGLSLYCNGYSLTGSSNNRLGLLYHDAEGNTFGLGIFRKQLEAQPENQTYLHIVSPCGPDPVRAVDHFIQELRERGIITNNVYVRGIPIRQKQVFMDNGFQEVNELFQPWHPEAPQEDETYHHSRIRIDDLIISPGQQYTFIDHKRRETEKTAEEYIIRILPSTTKDGEKLNSGARSKMRRRWKAANEWLEGNDASIVIEEADMRNCRHETAIRGIIHDHFESLRKRQVDIGSTPEDYMGILDVQKLEEVDQEQFYSYLVYLVNDRGEKKPIGYFAGEKIEKNTVAIYATITRRDSGIFGDKHTQQKRMQNVISSYVDLRILMKLKEEGIEVVEKGGSETKALDDAKKYAGAKKVETTWMVK